ncbi:hypothetical protein EMCG_01891 [[Emmonsia] crescens]|uniref:Uncharacterized protein n=1 Tax=[Emmonsia] crescens TaxID=73230 RepID=A0A0G2HZL9_9EURO|nr:hypothetical protein EMCG_01891 [Emmonsia crescens UAMH 3008]
MHPTLRRKWQWMKKSCDRVRINGNDNRVAVRAQCNLEENPASALFVERHNVIVQRLGKLLTKKVQPDPKFKPDVVDGRASLRGEETHLGIDRREGPLEPTPVSISKCSTVKFDHCARRNPNPSAGPSARAKPGVNPRLGGRKTSIH